jgi:arylsulfatase A-like enzyme
MAPSRSRPAPLLSLLLTAALLSAGVGGQPARAGAPRPNVLFVAVDDLNSWIGALKGHPGVKTPNLDRLAARGVAFTRAYCPAPACNPSRAALLTGRRPSSSGVYHNDQPWRPVLRDAVTLPRYFRDHGYEVRGGGKIFHGGYDDAGAWEGRLPRPQDPNPPGRPLNGIARTAAFDWGPLDVPDEQMGDWKLAEAAAEYLGQAREKPFFLAVGFAKPHLPWYVPRRYFDMFPLESVQLPEVSADDLTDVPAAGQRMARSGQDHRKVVESDNWKRAVQGYLASVAFADACVGRLLDGLDRGPHARNTVVVLWGDHGWHLGEKEHWRKFALWEQAARTTLLIAGPGVTPARCGRTVDLMDLYPTLVEYCGLPARPGLEARSLMPLLRNAGAEFDRPVLTTHGRGNHSVRSERWRYIRYADGGEELYDHDADPREWKNRAAEAALAPVKADLARHLPAADAPDAPRGRAAD